MAYVRTSRSRGKEYRQLVESYREDGKVKQRVLVHLPSGAQTPEHALEWCEENAKRYHWCAEREASNPFTRYHDTWRRAALRRAEEYTRKAEKYEAKARVLRDLLDSGKITPDAPEVRQERERIQEEWKARLKTMR